MSTPIIPKAAKAVLTFWFEKATAGPDLRWFQKNADFDKLLTDNFLSTLQSAAKCELASWRTTPQGRLAEIIVLDQFSRNIFRNTPQSFSQDPMALTLAQEAVASDALNELNSWEKMFMLMPYMHSESSLVHEEGLELFKQNAPSALDFELKHKVIIDRFGRYPHRNEILGRESTEEEIEFLKGPDSAF